MTTQRYFHGGIVGLKPGAYLLPPNEQAEPSGRSLVDYAEKAKLDAEFIRRDRVYLTTQKHIARVFAAVLPNGALYEVEPEGELEIDPDCPDGNSLMCARARVLQVVDPLVPFKEKDFMKYMAVMSGG